MRNLAEVTLVSHYSSLIVVTCRSFASSRCLHVQDSFQPLIDDPSIRPHADLIAASARALDSRSLDECTFSFPQASGVATNATLFLDIIHALDFLANLPRLGTLQTILQPRHHAANFYHNQAVLV